MRYQDLSIAEKEKLQKAGRENCQYGRPHGVWYDCTKGNLFHPLEEYRIKPQPPEYIQSHKHWLQDRATVLVTEVLRLVKAGNIDEVSIDYCNQLTAILTELEDLK